VAICTVNDFQLKKIVFRWLVGRQMSICSLKCEFGGMTSENDGVFPFVYFRSGTLRINSSNPGPDRFHGTLTMMTWSS